MKISMIMLTKLFVRRKVSVSRIAECPTISIRGTNKIQILGKCFVGDVTEIIEMPEYNK